MHLHLLSSKHLCNWDIKKDDGPYPSGLFYRLQQCSSMQ